jgi:hypothetical protein
MKVRIIIAFLFFFLLWGCRKNKYHPVPNIATDITIDINLPSYIALTGVSGWAYVNGGSKGIIVYRRATDEFIAYDRHSPADPEGTCGPLTPDPDNFLTLVDSCNAATFSLYDGSPQSNSEFGLRVFQTSWNGSSSLRIYN